jgi:hypothetical protein
LGVSIVEAVGYTSGAFWADARAFSEDYPEKMTDMQEKRRYRVVPTERESVYEVWSRIWPL